MQLSLSMLYEWKEQMVYIEMPITSEKDYILILFLILFMTLRFNLTQGELKPQGKSSFY